MARLGQGFEHTTRNLDLRGIDLSYYSQSHSRGRHCHKQFYRWDRPGNISLCSRRRNVLEEEVRYSNKILR